MKVGVLQFFSWSRRVPLETVYARAMERIAIMDEGGYDAVWLAEHHFNTYSVCPSVTLMGTQVAARTRRLRIGTAVTLAGFYHPLRLAEELALLDIFSEGRLNWGAGRGFDPTEMRAFGVLPEESAERYRESVDVVLKAFGDAPVSHHGKNWTFENIDVLPKPRQRPHPPVWLAATSPESVVSAARDGFTILMDPHSSHVQIAEKRGLYRKTLEEHGHALGGRDIPIARLLAIAPSDAEAREVARAGAAWTVGSYARPKGTRHRGGEHASADDPVERYVNEVVVHGSPERVTDELLRLRDELPMEYLLANPLSHETFVLFTEKVLPKLL